MLLNKIINNEWKFIILLSVLTFLSIMSSILISLPFGIYSLWGILILFYFIFLLKEKFWYLFLTLNTAIAPLAVFRGGIIFRGENIWSYIIILTSIYLFFKKKIDFFAISAFKWWILLIILGVIYLPFIEWPPGFTYSKSILIKLLTGILLLSISKGFTNNREFRESISQVSFLIMSVCSISLIFPVFVGRGYRFNISGINPNGIGHIAFFVIVAGAIYLLYNKRKKDILLVSSMWIITTAVIIKTASRQSILVSIIFLGLYFLMTLKEKELVHYFILICCIFFSFNYLIKGSEKSRIYERFDSVYANGEFSIDRLDHLKVGFSMLKENPLGLGGGGFTRYYYKYKTKAGIKSPYKHPHPHNLFAMVMADWGYLGLLLLLMGFFSLSRDIIRLKNDIFILKVLAFISLLLLANSGVNFFPVLMIYLGVHNPENNYKKL